MRDFSIVAVCAALLWAGGRRGEAAEMPDGVRTVVILHTNDLHGHLTAWTGWEGDLKGKTIGGLGRLAGAVAQARKGNEGGVLLLDAGDLIGDSMIADLTEGKAMIESLNHLRYDALAVGNHEPDFNMEKLRQRRRRRSPCSLRILPGKMTGSCSPSHMSSRR